MASAHRPRLDPVASDLLTALPDLRAVWNRAAGPEVEVLPFVAHNARPFLVAHALHPSMDLT